MSGSRLGLLAGAAGVALIITGAAFAAPPDDRILPAEMHQSDKARTLAAKHGRALRDLSAEIYHCLPWVETRKHSIGFYKPRHVQDDRRFLSIRLYIEQEPSPQFARLSIEQRASAMFSRYVGAVLKRMTRQPAVRNDDTIDGFTVILEWLKQVPEGGQRPVHETIAAFVDKVDGESYLSGQLTMRDLATKARVLGWDGETSVGALKLAAWDDDFVSTFRVKNYQPDPTISCRQ
ncbi:MAG: hypothetical protein HYU41_16040 [Candidatus Rokubacteria bacterium]|nr:hypothetical protein [Candidatus Rokubacteria bacterium]